MRDFPLNKRIFPNAIAVNNSWEIAPWAHTLFFGDERWWVSKSLYGGGNAFGNGKKALEGYNGDIVTTSPVRHNRITGYRHTPKIDTFDRHKEFLYGKDSGCKAISLAYRIGYKHILIAGIDLANGDGGETHWHGGHPTRVQPGFYGAVAPHHRALAEYLSWRGVNLVRVTNPGLPEIPYLSPDMVADWVNSGYDPSFILTEQKAHG